MIWTFRNIFIKAILGNIDRARALDQTQSEKKCQESKNTTEKINRDNKPDDDPHKL